MGNSFNTETLDPSSFPGQFRQTEWISKTLAKGTVGGVLHGITSSLSGDPDFSEISKNLGLLGGAIQNTGLGAQDMRDAFDPPDQQELTRRHGVAVQDANERGLKNALAIGTFNPRSTSAQYASSGATRPSDLAKISNPTAKFAVASSRGGARDLLNGVANQLDQQQPTGPTSATPNAAMSSGGSSGLGA